jgi:hypothetical protein
MSFHKYNFFLFFSRHEFNAVSGIMVVKYCCFFLDAKEFTYSFLSEVSWVGQRIQCGKVSFGREDIKVLKGRQENISKW